MKTVSSRVLAVISSIMIVLSVALPISSVAQTPDALLTEVASSAPPLAVKFSLNPVGNHEKSYFDDIEIEAGTSETLEAELLNFGDAPVGLRVFITNTTSSVNGGYLAGSRDDELFGSANWITFDELEITIQPGESVTLPFMVSVPEGTESGQYISSIVAETVDTLPIPGADNIDHRIRFAMAIGILVPGEIHQSFKLGEPTLSLHEIQVPISNTGNYLIRPEGMVKLTDSNGEIILNGPIKLSSIYSGVNTGVSIRLPVGHQSEEYMLSLSLEDLDSGAKASIENVKVTQLVSDRPAQFTVGGYEIEPNADEIDFANVSLTLNNHGIQVPASNLVLEVLHDGEMVEEFPIATNQVLLPGENIFSARYIPSDLWKQGTYTFRISVSAVDTVTGQSTHILTETLDAEIVVP